MLASRPGLSWLLAVGWLCFLGFLLLRVLHMVSSPPQTEQILTGYYSAGAETSSFVPCGTSARPGYGQGYWLTAETDSGFYAAFNRIVPDGPAHDWSYETPPVYIRFVGRLSAQRPGNGAGYGHGGYYTREVTVVRLIEMSPSQPFSEVLSQGLLAGGIAFFSTSLLSPQASATLRQTGNLFRVGWRFIGVLTTLFVVLFLGLQLLMPTVGCS